MVVTSPHDGHPRCRSCYDKVRVPCARCGVTARAERHWPEGPVCLACVDDVRFTHAVCSSCQQTRPVYRPDKHGPICPECAGVRFTYTCTTCGSMGRIHTRRTCPQCTATNLLRVTLASTTEAAAHRLEPFAEFLKQHYDNPYSLIAYLKGRGGTLLKRLAAGEVPCSHHGLDQLRQTRSVTHLRTLLVLCGLLEDRNEQLAQAHLRLHETLNEIAHDADRIVLGQFLRWYLLPFLHSRTGADGTLSGSVRYVVGQFTTARGFLDLLREQESSLSDCPQRLVDRWCRERPWQRTDLKRFLVWASTRGLAPNGIGIAAMTINEDRSIMPDTERVLLAVRLEEDDSIALMDRLAGCLVLQYAQHVTRIARLTTQQVITHPQEPGVLGLQLGTDPLWLRPRLSRILALYLDERGAAGQGATSEYLFSGQRPGRPISADTLTTRLRQMGVPNARRARNGALLAMIDQVHWKLVSDLLGISDSAAFRWHIASGGDRASYVASRIQLSRPVGPE